MKPGVARALAALLLGLAALRPAPAGAAVEALDDEGQRLTLAQPARRIISLAPHATELLYAAGAGGRLVATVRYADHPPEARALPQVGDALALDLERIVALRPDLIVVWREGSSAGQVERLRALKIPLFFSGAQTLDQVGDSLRRLGRLAGTTPQAEAAAQAYATRLQGLRARYSQRPPLRVFYQVWPQPLMTLNDRHLVGDALRLCGAVNVFGTQAALVPTVSQEAVLAARPQVLVTATADGRPDDSLAPWAGLRHFEPVARQRVVWLHADWITRQGPRILDGTQELCEGLDRLRASTLR